MVQVSSGNIGLLLWGWLLPGCCTSLALIGSWCIGAVSIIHFGGAFPGEESGLSTRKTAIARGADIGVVAGVVVEVSSSGTLRGDLMVGVVVVGVLHWGWSSLWLGRLPRWGLVAEP
jgi:hypothetical protein